MTGVLFASPLPIAAITASRGGGVARLLTADPRESFVDVLVGAPVTIAVDLGAVMPVDTVHVGFTNAPNAQWSATGGVGGPAEVALFDDRPFAVPAGSNRPAGFVLLPQPVAVRYVAVKITQPVGALVLQAGVLAVAKALQPEWGHEWGGGRGLLDLAPKTRHAGGGFGIGGGIRKATWSATLGDLDDVELAQLWALAKRHGESRPLLIVEEPSRTDGLGDRMHWAVFDRIEPYERRSVGRTRWAVRLEDWL